MPCHKKPEQMQCTCAATCCCVPEKEASLACHSQDAADCSNAESTKQEGSAMLDIDDWQLCSSVLYIVLSCKHAECHGNALLWRAPSCHLSALVIAQYSTAQQSTADATGRSTATSKMYIKTSLSLYAFLLALVHPSSCL